MLFQENKWTKKQKAMGGMVVVVVLLIISYALSRSYDDPNTYSTSAYKMSVIESVYLNKFNALQLATMSRKLRSFSKASLKCRFSRLP